MGIEHRLIRLQGRLQWLLGREREQGLRKATQIPQADIGLLIKGIPTVMVGMIADEARIIAVHESKGSIDERHTDNRHVIRVHDAMREADGLPLRDETCRSADDLSEEPNVTIGLLDE